MRVIVSSLLLSTFLLTGSLPVMAADEIKPAPAAPVLEGMPGQSRPTSFADLTQKLLPTVVNVSSTGKASDVGPTLESDTVPTLPPSVPPGSPFEDFYENYMNRQQSGPLVENTSLGSGFIIDADKGLIITNNHVIRDAADIRITLHDDSSYKAKVIGVDDKTDIALIKIDPVATDHLEAVKLGDSDTLRVGDWILAIGNPFGLGGTVTAGIVSARSRDINAGPYDDFIQTDASINRGNSGGPMFNTKGELIGINTAIFSPSGGSVGIGFAIPVNMSKPIINQLIKYGKTKRGWLGVKIQTVTPEIAESLGLEGRPHGTLIANVTADGPGQKAGMKAYDILLSFNGHDIRTMRDLPRLVAEAEIDKDIPITIFRDGKTMELTTRLGELETAEKEGMMEGGMMPDMPQSGTPDLQNPLQQGDPSGMDDDGGDMTLQAPVPQQQAPVAPAVSSKGLHYKSLKLVIAPITREISKQYNLIDGMSGLVITKVDDYSDAARKGLLPGDIIMEVDQNKVGTSEDILAAISAARSQKRTSMLILTDRAGDERFVAIKLEPAAKAKAAPKRTR